MASVECQSLFQRQIGLIQNFYSLLKKLSAETTDSSQRFLAKKQKRGIDNTALVEYTIDK